MIFNRPQIHFTSEKGWINDPNGCIYFKGKYHIFFQHNKHSNEQVNICWGHAISEDLIHFTEYDDALTNDQSYDKIGCWSGGAAVIDDKLYLLYTSFGYDSEGNEQQTISLAYSEDGINFTKYENNPVIRNDNKPEIASTVDFRDPFIFRKNEKFYILIGSKKPEKGLAMVLLYESVDLINFKFIKTLSLEEGCGTMFECPSLLEDGDNSVLIISPQNLPKKGNEFDNISSSIYQISHTNYLTEDIKLDNIQEIDHGCEYYAPLLFTDDSRKLMIAWNYMWGRRYIHKDYNLDWCGNLTIPREINIIDGKLRSKPIAEVNRFLSNASTSRISVENGKPFKLVENLKLFRLNVEFADINDLVLDINLISKENEYVNLNLDYSSNTITFNRTKVKEQLYGIELNDTKNGIRKCKLLKKNIDILFDEHILEVFFNEYFDSMSNLICMDLDRVEIVSNKDIVIDVELRKKN